MLIYDWWERCFVQCMVWFLGVGSTTMREDEQRRRDRREWAS